MKRFLKVASAGLLLATLAIVVSACQIGPVRFVNGSGNLQTEQRVVRDFSAVELRGDGTLVIEQGSTEALSIEAEDNILPLITSTVEDKRLVLDQDNYLSIRATKPITYRLTVKNLNAITINGAANAEAARLQADQLTLRIGGSGNIAITQLVANRLTVEVSGSGDLDLGGTVGAQDVALGGSSDYRAGKLASTTARVAISGSGNATVRVSNTLDARISGSGNIAYLGTPQVTESITGSGNINQRSEP